MGARRPFLVTDPGLIEAGWVDEAVGHLKMAGLCPVVWHDVTPNPKDHEILARLIRYVTSDDRRRLFSTRSLALARPGMRCFN